MKKALLIAAMVAMSTSAYASKARVQALGASPHLNDIQDIMTKPDRVATYGEWATVEFGQSTISGSFTDSPTIASVTAAEGGFVRQSGQSAWGAYLGQGSASVAALRTIGSAVAGVTFLPQENPIRLFYAQKGDMNWGVGFLYSDSKSVAAAAEEKQNLMALSGGWSGRDWDAQFQFGLANNATETTGEKLSGKLTYQLNYGKKVENNYYYVAYGAGGAKTANAGGTDVSDVDQTTYRVGFVTSHKKDGTDFFYGLSYRNLTIKDKISTTDQAFTSLPLIIGVETEAMSWLILRGSVTHNVSILGLSKNKTAATTETTGANSTTVRVGTGFKWGKAMIDAIVVAGGADNGDLNTANDQFLNQMSLTYTF